MSNAEHLHPFEALLRDVRPKRTVWTAVCEQIEVIHDEGELKEVSDGIEPWLTEWSDAQRFTPEPWIKRLLEGDPLDCMIITRSLDLRGRQIGYVDADLLSQSPELLFIRRLNLAYNGLQNSGTRALLSSDVVSALTYLDLSGNSIEVEGVRAIAECAHLENLRHLDLTGNWVSDEAAKLLANSPHLANLESLVLRGNPIKQAGAEALASSPFLADAIKQRWSNP